MDVNLEILIRRVKSKPFNTSFKKQLNLYTGEPFINSTKLQYRLNNAPFDLGRAKEVVETQLANPAYQKLLFEGDIND